MSNDREYAHEVSRHLRRMVQNLDPRIASRMSIDTDLEDSPSLVISFLSLTGEVIGTYEHLIFYPGNETGYLPPEEAASEMLPGVDHAVSTLRAAQRW